MILAEPLAKFIDYGNAVFEGDKKSGTPVEPLCLAEVINYTVVYRCHVRSTQQTREKMHGLKTKAASHPHQAAA